MKCIRDIVIWQRRSVAADIRITHTPQLRFATLVYQCSLVPIYMCIAYCSRFWLNYICTYHRCYVYMYMLFIFILCSPFFHLVMQMWFPDQIWSCISHPFMYLMLCGDCLSCHGRSFVHYVVVGIFFFISHLQILYNKIYMGSYC